MSKRPAHGTGSGDPADDLFENAPCGYITLGTDRRIARVNRTFLTWSGFRADQLVGQPFHECLNIAGRIFFETHIAPLLRMQGFFNEFAIDFIDAGRNRLPAIANALEIRDLRGQPTSIRIALIKAPDRRRYERELVDARNFANQELREEQETAELREQFIAVLSHDLRNPLAALSAGARLMLKARSKDDAEKLESMMQASVGRMGHLIDNVMDFARGRLGGGLVLDLVERPVEPLLSQVVAELQSTHPECSIEADFQITRTVRCDPLRLAQMFSNLLGNALTHGKEGAPIKVTAMTRPNYFELSVANKGEKISTETMSHLFQPFYRGKVRPSMQGLGLGLYIASEIAKAHEGRIVAESTDVETRFTFVMPLKTH